MGVISPMVPQNLSSGKEGTLKISLLKEYGPCEPRLFSNVYLRKLKGLEYSCPDYKRSHRIRSAQRIPFLESTLSINIYTVSCVVRLLRIIFVISQGEFPMNLLIHSSIHLPFIHSRSIYAVTIM